LAVPCRTLAHPVRTSFLNRRNRDIMFPSGYRGQLQFLLPPPEQDGFQLPVLWSREIWILLQYPRRFLPGLFQDLGVSDEIDHPQIGGAPLPGPEELARPADAQVLFGHHKAIVTLDQRLKAAPRLLRQPVRPHQETIRLMRPAPDPSPTPPPAETPRRPAGPAPARPRSGGRPAPAGPPQTRACGSACGPGASRRSRRGPDRRTPSAPESAGWGLPS